MGRWKREEDSRFVAELSETVDRLYSRRNLCRHRFSTFSSTFIDCMDFAFTAVVFVDLGSLVLWIYGLRYDQMTVYLVVTPPTGFASSFCMFDNLDSRLRTDVDSIR